jgi:hypothetical protein
MGLREMKRFEILACFPWTGWHRVSTTPGPSPEHRPTKTDYRTPTGELTQLKGGCINHFHFEVAAAKERDDMSSIDSDRLHWATI